MPQLVIDKTAMDLAIDKLSGQPVFAGPDGGLLAPGVIDLDEDGPGARWQPNDSRAQQLVLGAEACRDIVFHTARLSEAGHKRRKLAAMTVPVCSLMDVVGKLLTEFNKGKWLDARKDWPRADQKTYKTVSRTFRKKRQRGPVRKARNTRGAHLDPAVLREGVRLSTDDLLLAQGDSLILLMLLLNHPQAFSWIRGLGVTEDGKHRVVETMYTYPVCVRWLTDLDGHVEDAGMVQLAADPATDLQAHILGL